MSKHIPQDTNLPLTIDRNFITTRFTKVYTEIEAAECLRVSRITLQRIRLRGEIAFSRVGGSRVVYTSKNLTDYLATREQAAFR